MGTMPTKYTIDPNGDVIITLRNFGTPFAVLQKNNELYIPTKISPPFVSFAVWQGEKSQSLNNGVGYKPVKVAPPEPGENTVTSEAQIEPSTTPPEIHLQVSSAHLTLASRYFKTAFGGPFTESKPDADGLRHVDASDWDTWALLIVLRIIHGRNCQVPRSLDLEMLAKVAVIVDYYKCYEAVDAFAEIWLQRIKGTLLLGSFDRDLILLLHISCVFRWTEGFKAVTKTVLHHSKGPLDTLNLPIPEKVTFTINNRRIAALRKIAFALGALATRFRQEPPDCSFECASMNLGALSRQIHNNWSLNSVVSGSGSFDGHSIALVMDAARKIRSPDWSCSNYPKRPGPFCRLDRLIKSDMDKIENLDGLSLKDFGQSI
ncbi:hypothetical protein F4782DRAFT_164592 [Xylaria castorea]|nr:hypothetical protein F4782DRAFT_164592 [Xylaria castorea]